MDATVLRTLLTALVISSASGAANAAAQPNAPKRLATSIRGSIEASLVRLDKRAGAALAAQVARLLRWRGDIVQQVHPKDQLRLLFEPGPDPQLIAVEFVGSAIRLKAYRTIAGDGVPRYYDAAGIMIEPGIEASPLGSYVQITETVQRGSGKRRHMGLDLKAPTGTPVQLPFDATISRVNWSTRGNGLCVEVLYTTGVAAGRIARFLHLSEVATEMVPGAKLPAATLVGAVGSTGRSSAPHLHYEVRQRDGHALSPLQVHSTTERQLEPSLRARFAGEVERYDRLLAGKTITN